MDDERTVLSSTKDGPFISGTSRNPKMQDLANARRLRRSSDKNMKGQSSHAFSSLQSSISTGHKIQTHRPGEGVHELVKYMSTVPSYLQDLEKSDTSQTKALNMGVIDWGNLQKWQYRHGAVENHENVDSSGRCAPTSSEICGSSSVCVKKTSSAPRHRHESHRGGNQTQVGHKKSSRPFSSFLNMDATFHSVGQPGTSGSNSGSNVEKVKTGNSNCSGSCGRCNSPELGSFRSASSILDVEEALHTSKTKIGTVELSDADLEKTRSGGSSGAVHTTPENVRRNGQSIEGTQTVEDLRNWSDRFSFESAGSDNPSAVLNCEKFSGLYMSEDPYLTAQYSDVPHSCPFPLGCSDNGLLQGPGPGEWNCISNPLTLPNAESIKLSSGDRNNGPDCSKIGKSMVDKLSVKLPMRCAGSISADGGLNDVSEVMLPISRKTLPADRCTVTTGRRRPNEGDSTTSKATCAASSKLRQRPLRKMLDVLLKSRSSNQQSHGTATASPVDNLWRRLSFAGKTVPREDAQVRKSLDVPDIHASVGTCVGGRKSMTSSAWVSSPLGAEPQDQKHEASKKRQQALMRLSWKDQLPVFTFSMDDSDVLAAYRRKATLLSKHNSNCCYSIYNISKAKKKHGGGWMNQGSRQTEFVSRAVAKIVYSSHPCHGTDEYSSATERQFVLVGSQLRPTTLSKRHFTQENELAAFIIRLPEFTWNDYTPGVQKASDPGDYGLNTMSTTDESSYDLQAQTDVEARVNVGSCNTIAILPSEVHGSSDTGGPSPLIERWKSGGVCDCGGWDVGCSLTILSGDHCECKSKIDQQQPSFTTNGRVQTELFVQGRSTEDMPVFCLAELNQGLYEVEFEPFIATLQAFSLCVGIVHCQMTECPPPVVPNFLRQVDAGNSHNRNVGRAHVEAPASYVLNRPPLSPVGRA